MCLSLLCDKPTGRADLSALAIMLKPSISKEERHSDVTDFLAWRSRGVCTPRAQTGRRRCSDKDENETSMLAATTISGSRLCLQLKRQAYIAVFTNPPSRVCVRSKRHVCQPLKRNFGKTMAPKSRLLHFALLINVLHLLPSTYPTPGETLPVAHSRGLLTSDVDTSTRPNERGCQRTTVKRQRTHSRRALQDEMDGDVDGGRSEEGQTANSTQDTSQTTSVCVSVEAYTCHLRGWQIQEYLEPVERIWRVDAAVLDAIDSDLQSLVNCTLEGDTLLFDVRGTIKPTTRVTIPWSLTMSAVTDSTRLVDGIYPRAPKKTSFTCPDFQQGVFLVK